MKICPRCRNTLEDNMRFCENCGMELPASRPVQQGFYVASDSMDDASPYYAPYPAEPAYAPPAEPPVETVYCPNCGRPTGTATLTCINCGAPIENEVRAAQRVAKKSAKKPKTERKKIKLSKKAVKFGIIGIAALAVIITVLILILGGDSQEMYCLYMKNGEIMLSNMRGDPSRVSADFADSSYYDNEDCYDYSGLIAGCCYISEDGEKIFYMEGSPSDSGGLKLYCREIGGKNSSAVRISDNATRYYVNDSASSVFYLTDEKEFYLYNMRHQESQRIDDEVSMVGFSDDGNTAVYITEDGDIYRCKAGDTKEKLVSSADYLRGTNSDCSTVYYLKDDDFCCTSGDEDMKTLCKDVDTVLCVYESGEAYFLKKSTDTVSLMDYVTDDMKEQDEKFELPDAPRMPSWWDYETTEEYDAAYAQYEKDRAEYDKYYEQGVAKQRRDELRSDLAGETLELSVSTLYYYDGKEVKALTENMNAASSYDYSTEAAVLVFTELSGSSTKAMLSEIESIAAFRELIYSQINGGGKVSVAVGAELSEIELGNVSRLSLADSGDAVYCLCEAADEHYGELYKSEISDGKAKEAERIDKDVYENSVWAISDETVIYAKDYEDNEFELYVSGKKVDEGVSDCCMRYNDVTDELYYFVDWNSSKKYGTLKCWSDGDRLTVEDDVSSFVTLSDGRVLYLSDYSRNDYEGDLYVWDDGDAKRIDNDVSCILDVRYAGACGSSFYVYGTY